MRLGMFLEELKVELEGRWAIIIMTITSIYLDPRYGISSSQ